MRLSKILSLVFGIIILILIIKSIGFSSLINVLKKFNFIYLPLIVILLIFDYTLAGLNTWMIASGFRKVSLFYTIKSTFITLVYAVVFPGKTADLLMIPLLKKERLTFSQSTISVILDKVVSLLIKAVFGLFGAISILKKFNFTFLGIPSIAILLIILIISLTKSNIFLNFVKQIILKKYALL